MAVEKHTPCYICWFLTIALAIPAGILLTDAIKAGIAYASFDRIANRIAINTKRMSSSETKTPKLTKIETPEEDIPTVKLSPKDDISENGVYIKVLPEKKKTKKGVPKEKMPGYQTTLKTCNFWTKEYKEEATSKNGAYMEAACNRLKTYE